MSSRKVYWKVNVTKESTDCCLRIILSQLFHFVFSLILGLERVPKDLPPDTTLLDLQNNKITEIKEGDFKNLKNLHVSVYMAELTHTHTN